METGRVSFVQGGMEAGRKRLVRGESEEQEFLILTILV